MLRPGGTRQDVLHERARVHPAHLRRPYRRDGYAASFADWPRTLAAIEAGDIALEHPGELADRWVGEGVLLLNSSLTLTRFDVTVDAHQSRGHLPIWRPLIVKVLAHLAGSGRPIVFLGFGDAAAGNLERAGLTRPEAPLATVPRDHPAVAEKVLGRENPFVSCNRHLESLGERPIAW